MKTADQPVQRPPAALTRSSCRAEWIGTAQDGTSQQAPRTDVDASAELSDREKFVRALSRDSAERAPWGENRESGPVMRRRQVRRLGYQAHHITSLHFRIYLPVTRFGCDDDRRTVTPPAVTNLQLFACSASDCGGDSDCAQSWLLYLGWLTPAGLILGARQSSSLARGASVGLRRRAP